LALLAEQKASLEEENGRLSAENNALRTHISEATTVRVK